VAELVDALDLGSSAARCGGSSPSWGTKIMKKLFLNIYLLVIVLPLLILSAWHGRNFVGEQIDDFEED
jgi:hypothetical protein